MRKKTMNTKGMITAMPMPRKIEPSMYVDPTPRYKGTCVACGKEHSRYDWDNSMKVKTGMAEMHCHTCRQETLHANVKKEIN